MTTAHDIVRRAFRKIGVTAHDDEMTADQAAVGLEALNAVMHEIALRGVDLEHADVALTDAFPLAPEFERGFTYMLAREISPDFSAPGLDDDVFFRAIQARYMVIPEISQDSVLRTTPSQDGWQRSIET